MSDRSDDWFRDPAPRSSGRGGSGYPGASEPAESVFGGGNRGSVWESGGQQPGGAGYRNAGAWPEQPPAHGGRSGRHWHVRVNVGRKRCLACRRVHNLVQQPQARQRGA